MQEAKKSQQLSWTSHQNCLWVISFFPFSSSNALLRVGFLCLSHSIIIRGSFSSLLPLWGRKSHKCSRLTDIPIFFFSLSMCVCVCKVLNPTRHALYLVTFDTFETQLICLMLCNNSTYFLSHRYKTLFKHQTVISCRDNNYKSRYTRQSKQAYKLRL